MELVFEVSSAACISPCHLQGDRSTPEQGAVGVGQLLRSV